MRGLAGCLTILVVLVLAAVADWAAYSLTPDSKAIHAVQDLGYTNVQVIDKEFVLPFSVCSEKDEAVFTVQGTDPRGAARTITVCAGVWKGGTVRSN